MDVELLGKLIAIYTDKLDGLIELHNNLQEQVDALAEATEALTEVTQMLADAHR